MARGIYYHLNTILRRWHVLAFDMLWIVAAWFGAYWMRSNLESIPEDFLNTCTQLLPYVFMVQLIVNYVVGLHRGEWRFVSLPDFSQIFKAVIFGTACIAFTAFVVTRLYLVPRSVFVFYAMILGIGLGGSRVAYRLMKDRHFTRRSGRRVVILGAGSAADQLVRDLRRNYPKKYNVVAFLDDDVTKVGSQIQGITVVASCDVLEEIVERWGVELALIAMPSANEEEMQRVVKLCKDADIDHRTLPGVHELLTGKVSLTDLREVKIEDLLGREPVKLDWHRIRSSLQSKSVLVTGAGGSIGSELARQLAALQPDHLILFERSEFNLYQIEAELLELHPNIKVTPILGDITDKVSLENAFSLFQPQIIFHAAAYKHVPLLEGQTREAVKNNIIGTKNVADVAYSCKCETFVLISTDKAVNPSSLMGACKRAAEIYCQMLASKSASRFITVRFGNVLGSAGSVVPRFQKQIKSGGPVTVTNASMTRYFMTIIEATQLILEASVVGADGRIYVLDMGAPVKIVDLAKQLIILSGKEPDKDIKIEFTGTRPGEKLEEELFHIDESLQETSHEKLLLAKTRETDSMAITHVFNSIENAVDENSHDKLLNALNQLVPEYEVSGKASPSQQLA